MEGTFPQSCGRNATDYFLSQAPERGSELGHRSVRAKIETGCVATISRGEITSMSREPTIKGEVSLCFVIMV